MRKVKGKSVSESFSDPAALRQAAEQVAEFRRFQALTAELTAVNEQICRLRPSEHREAGWTEEEKTRLLPFISKSHAKSGRSSR